MIRSWVASLFSRHPVSLPSCMTQMRSLIPKIYGSSEEIMMMATPSHE